jgi:hypothetical protein
VATLDHLAKIALQPAPGGRHPGNSNDAIAAQFDDFVRGNTEALQDFCGVLAKFGDMRRDLIAAQTGHLYGGTENLDVVVIADGPIADNVTFGKFGIGCYFLDFTHRSARDLVREEKRDEIVTSLHARPFSNHLVNLVH